MRSAYLKLGLLISCFLIAASGWSQAKKISGTISSEEDGKPLPGVNVAIKGKTVGTQTNSTVEYSIDAGAGYVRVFTYTGFASRDVKLVT